MVATALEVWPVIMISCNWLELYSTNATWKHPQQSISHGGIQLENHWHSAVSVSLPTCLHPPFPSDGKWTVETSVHSFTNSCRSSSPVINSVATATRVMAAATTNSDNNSDSNSGKWELKWKCWEKRTLTAGNVAEVAEVLDGVDLMRTTAVRHGHCWSVAGATGYISVTDVLSRGGTAGVAGRRRRRRNRKRRVGGG